MTPTLHYSAKQKQESRSIPNTRKRLRPFKHPKRRGRKSRTRATTTSSIRPTTTRIKAGHLSTRISTPSSKAPGVSRHHHGKSCKIGSMTDVQRALLTRTSGTLPGTQRNDQSIKLMKKPCPSCKILWCLAREPASLSPPRSAFIVDS